jgi:hypothetical protein
MHYTGYLAWINDDQYWHRDFRAAQARVVLAQFSGKDTLLRSLKFPSSVWSATRQLTQ